MATIDIALTVSKNIHNNKEKLALDNRFINLTFDNITANDIHIDFNDPVFLSVEEFDVPHEYFKQFDTDKGYDTYFGKLFFKDIKDIENINKKFPNTICFEIFEGAIIQFMASDLENSINVYSKNKVKALNTGKPSTLK